MDGMPKTMSLRFSSKRRGTINLSQKQIGVFGADAFGLLVNLLLYMYVHSKQLRPVILTTLFLGKHKLKHYRPYKAACYPTKFEILNDIKLFPTGYRRKYCRNFFNFIHKSKCIRITIN